MASLDQQSFLKIPQCPPEIFDIGTAPEIRNTPDAWKNPDHILGRGIELEDLDAMRRIFSVCRKRGIKLSPSKLQIGRRIKWGGVIVESVGQADGDNDVFISADEQKVADLQDQLPSVKCSKFVVWPRC